MKHKANLLVIDDHPDNLRTLSKILTEEGYKVRKAINGEIALETINFELPDLILLDIKIPDIDGYEILLFLQNNIKTSEIPVIFLTVLDDTNSKKKAFEMGCVDYITKPFKIEEVLIRINHQVTILKQKQELNKQYQNLQKEIQKRKQVTAKLQLLLKTINLVTKSINFDQALHRVLCELRKVLDWDYGENWITDIDDEKLYLSKTCYDQNDQRLKSFEENSKKYKFSYGIGVQGRVWRGKQVEWIEDINEIEEGVFIRSPLAKKAGLRAVLTVPIHLHEQAIIVICFFKRSPTPYNSGLVKLVNAVALELGVFIEYKHTEEALKKANQELLKLANMDSLTQIANRRCFDQKLNQEWRRMYREKLPLSLILCDIDYFKLYNDYYGHPAGDECLYQVAQAISQTCQRPGDLVARYGGEELVIILPNTNIQGAIYIAENIQEKIANLAIPHQCSLKDTNITLSIGIATIIPETENSPETIIAEADKALYQAKAQGRNQYCFYSSI